MFSEQLSRRLAARGIHYGWVIAALGFFYALVSSSALGVPGVLVLPMSHDLGLSIGDLSAPQGLRLALFGMVAPFAGGLVLRFGARAMLIAAAVLLLAGLLLAVVSTQLWQIWLGIGIVLGVAPGLTALQLQGVLASRWFTAHRGVVLGLLSGSNAAGMLLFMPLASWIAQHWGWRAAFLPTIAGMTVLLVLCILLFRDYPLEVGLPPVGETALAPMPGRVQGNFIAITFRVLGTGIRRPIFWVLCATFSICGLSSLGITQVHFVPFCTDSGVPQVTAASLLALIGVCDLIGTMASGWLSDRYDNRMLLGIYYALRGVALVWLVYGRPGLTSLSIFSVVFGLDFIATLPPTIKLSIAAFGRENGAAMLGWILAGHQMGAGLFAALAGISRDALHSYGPSFLAAGLACFAASICISLVRRPGEAGLRPAPARG